MSACICRHTQIRHSDGTGRCDGESYDAEFDTTYACVCPAYRPQEKAVPLYCEARLATVHGWTGIYPRCALAPGHDGEHATTYGLKFNDKGEVLP